MLIASSGGVTGDLHQHGQHPVEKVAASISATTTNIIPAEESRIIKVRLRPPSNLKCTECLFVFLEKLATLLPSFTLPFFEHG